MPSPALYSDHILHSASILLATLIADPSMNPIEDADLKEDLITAYRCVRRHIQVNPTTGKRFGAAEAHNAMQGVLN